MGENNQENQTPNEQQDPRLIQPEIIGELKKDRIGKPVMVIELFLLFGIVFAALPFIYTELNDENSKIYKWLYPNDIPSDVISDDPNKSENEFTDGSQQNLLQPDTKMRYESIVMKNITIGYGKIMCTMYAYTGEINLDERDLYLEISSTSNQVLGSIKLVGTLDNVEKEVELEAFGISFNSDLGYLGRIVEMEEEDYPDIEFTDIDMNGFAKLACTRNTRTITYNFQNNYLYKIEDEDHVIRGEQSDTQYLNLLELAQTKSSQFGPAVSATQEVDDGFIFKAVIDYDTEYVIPEDIVDYNYYPKDTLAKKIAFAQKSKGYDCK